MGRVATALAARASPLVAWSPPPERAFTVVTQAPFLLAALLQPAAGVGGVSRVATLFPGDRFVALPTIGVHLPATYWAPLATRFTPRDGYAAGARALQPRTHSAAALTPHVYRSALPVSRPFSRTWLRCTRVLCLLPDDYLRAFYLRTAVYVGVSYLRVPPALPSFVTAVAAFSALVSRILNAAIFAPTRWRLGISASGLLLVSFCSMRTQLCLWIMGELVKGDVARFCGIFTQA